MNHKNMKMTEVGWIPKDWEVKTLGEIGSIKSGGTPSTGNPDFWNGDINWFTPSEITNSPKYVSSSERKITKLGVDNSGARLLPIGTILLTTRASIGDCAILEKEGTTNQGFHPIIVNEEITNNEFIYYVLGSLKGEMLKNSLGSTFLEISPTNLKSIRFALPTSHSEQRRIAQVLSDTDSLIASLSRTIEKKRLVKQGAMQQLLTGKTRLKGFSGDWVEKELGEILKYEQPQEYLVHDTEYIETGIPVLTAGKTFILGYTYEQDGVYDKLPCILFDDFTTASRFVNFKFKVKSSAAKILTLRNKMDDLRLIYELMQLIDFPLQDHQRYWISEFSHLTISIPDDPNEQFAISERLRTMDNEIASLEAELQKYKALKQGMMQKLLTGQIILK